jgi:molybdopterin-guanine dinucleotide biosynthesis protein A
MTCAACAGVVLSGGLNTRMEGHNKAFFELDGRRFLDRILDTLRYHFNEIILVTREAALYQEWDLKIVHDILDVRSPLTGIHAGLVNAKAGYAFCIGCDTPFLKKSAVELLINELETGIDIVVPVSGSYFQPLCAVYSKQCSPIIEEQLRRGDLKIDHLFSKVALKKIPYEKFKAVDPYLLSFFNVNTPEDYREAEKLLTENHRK